ncbi:MAG: hypothetical protein JST11_25905 [Acidobacteria bacterium]|nr:hypothetical protein [Acidobacteriota bacterium]
MGRLIGEARRRILGNELLAQGAGAASAALAAFILLLLLGSEILSWPVVVMVPVVAFAIGAWRVRRRMPSRYVVAQIVDARLGLKDAISTAVYFEDAGPDAHADAGLLSTQREEAERTAGSADARAAIPIAMPRGIYAVAVLTVVAASLFGLRYGLERRLDLKQPLAAFLPEAFHFGRRTEQASDRARNPKQPPMTPDESGEGVQKDQQAQSEHPQDQPSQNEAQTPSEAGPDADAKTAGKNSKEQPDTQMATDDASEQNGDNLGRNSDDKQDGQQGDSKSAQNSQPDAGNKQDANESGENSSLMDKMKDAFQNLLSRVKPPQQPQPNGRQQDQKGQQGRSQQSAKQQNGKQGQQQNAGQQGDSQEGENGEQAKNDENAQQQQKGQGQSDSQQASKQPGSGIGSQDGDKAIKNAEQLQAMGKLTEILGKRSQNLTGEATVEVRQTSQQLRTNYVEKGAQHSQAGAEISRDEVPVALQPYVQQYFEQVRKQTGTAPAASKK